MITILLAMLILLALRRGVLWAWPVVLLVTSAGCSLPPTSQVVTFPEHRINRDDSTTQKTDEKRDHAEFLAAHQRWQQHDFSGCRQLLGTLLAHNPKHCGARLLLADMLLSSGQSQAALVQVQEALKYCANNPDVQYAMGLTLDANGRPDEAVAFYRQASRTAPTNDAYLLSYRTACDAAARRKTQIAGDAGKTPTAANWGPASPVIAPVPSPTQPLTTTNSAPAAGNTVPLNPLRTTVAAGAGSAAPPGFATVTAGSADNRFENYEDYSVAGNPLRLSLRPTEILCANSGSIVDSAGGQSSFPIGSTVVPASANFDGQDHSAEYLEKGQDALKSGSPTLAEALFRKAVACNAEDPQIPITAATYCLKYKEPKMAVAILTPAAQRFPASAAVFRCLGAARLQSGDYPAAQKDLEQSLSLDKSSALSHFLMGCTLTKIGQLEAAERDFRQAETLDPRYAVQH